MLLIAACTLLGALSSHAQVLRDWNPPPLVDGNSIQLPYRQLSDFVSDDTAPLRGSKSADLTIVFFDDLECPFSAAAYKTLVDDVLKDYGSRVALRIWPTFNSEIHPWAMHAAINAKCVASQNTEAFWEYTDAVHHGLDRLTLASAPFDELDRIALEAGRKSNLSMKILRECVTAQVETPAKDAYRKALDSGLHAVPTLLIGSEHLEGARSAQEYRAVIDNVLAQTDQSRAQTKQ
jgi:protein-disulfide isomerase